MAEYLLSDYLTSEGGAANDSTSCSAAIQAALDDIGTNDGGSLAFDAVGVCRNTVKNQLELYIPFRLQGYGDCPVRLMSLSDRHLSLTAQQETIEIDGMVFLGQLGSFGSVGYSSGGNPTLYFGGAIASMKNTKVLGVTCSLTASGGPVTFNNCMATVDGCIFNGSGGQFGVLVADQWQSLSVKNSEFLDYATWGGDLYSRTPDVGIPAWIRLDNPHSPMNDVRDTGGFVLENCVFDEGAQYSVYMEGGLTAKVTNCKTNVGAGSGYHFEGIDALIMENVWIGYTTSGSKRGITIKDIPYARLEAVKFAQDVDYIEISGTTQKVVLEGCDLNVGNNVTYPTSIYNPAGAEVVVNGVRTKGSIVQFG